MTSYEQNDPKHGCHDEEPPADQPTSGGDCPDLPTTTPPDPFKPPDCPKPPDCNCPDPPGATDHCLEDLITAQNTAITVAEKAKAFKAELEGLLTKARAASQEYTAKKYGELLKKWDEQDQEIVKLIHTLVCAVPCWRCIIECYVCPILNDLRSAEQQLVGDGKLCTDMHSIYDLRYWHERDTAAKERVFNRIKLVLAAWEKPAQTIEKVVLTDDAKLIVDIGKTIGSDPASAVYDLFLKLIPMHLAIAPPAADKKTRIGKRFTVFCECDTGKPEDCCGPDVGELSLRDRLIGPQPYLIKPDQYFKLICCLVEKFYGPAKDQFAEAAAALEAKENEIKRYKDRLENGLKDFEKNAKAKIPSPIECCGDKLQKLEQQPNQTAS
jgi:hypothetical protein